MVGEEPGREAVVRGETADDFHARVLDGPFLGRTGENEPVDVRVEFEGVGDELVKQTGQAGFAAGIFAEDGEGEFQRARWNGEIVR